MSTWIVTPCLLALRDEFDRVSPKRDKGADGTVGDTAHQKTGTSDHLPDEDTPALRSKDADHRNEVHALDIDSSGPWPGGATWFNAAIDRVLDQQRRDSSECRLEYIIWNRRIASRTRGWVWRTYTGTADPHTNHAHFSARYLSRAEGDTHPWGVYEEDDVPTADQISAEIIKDVRNTREFLSDTNVDIIAKAAAAKLTPVLNQLLAMAKGEAAEKPPTVDEIKAAVLNAVGGLPSAQEKAALLGPLLGDDAAEVGRLLASA